MSGNFAGPTSSSESGTTDANGQVTLGSRATRNPVGEWCFQVTDVSLSGATYDAGANVVTEACESGPVGKAGHTSRTSAIGVQFLGGYPNPVKHSTQIAFRLPKDTRVVLEVFTIRGERVAVLADRRFGAGQHLFAWSPENMANGIYILRLRTAEKTDTRRIVLMR